jgi:FtsP/CotA-like multicopper oxidase with cupredoxin domain
MALHVHDEDLESAEDHSSTSVRSSTAEQEQGLLRKWKEDEDDDIEEFKEKSDVRRPAAWGWTVWVATAVTSVVALGIAVGFVVVLGRGSDPKSNEALDVQTNDYILSPQWDFDAAPQRREYTWTVRNQIHNPDGIYRPMMLVNSQFPGPLIEANQGDTIVVHVDNQAVNATSLHWHGIYQNGTPHMDGTVGITQCPIPPGGKFTYEFTASGQSGTYWWHAHQGVQSSDGMHGPLVIHSPGEKQLRQTQYATDRVVLLSDHYHDLSSALLWQYLKPDMENAEPVPESALINGRTIRNCDDYPDRKCDNTTANVGQPVFNLATARSHRLRLINVGAFAEFQVQIDEHELAVTEVDGTDVTPVAYHRVNINPAQRYSVVVNASALSAEDFWFRARMITRCFTDPPKTLQPDAYGVVRYNTASKKTPASIDWQEKLDLECRDMNTTDLTPVQVIPAPAEADAFFYFRTNFEIGDYRLSRGVFDSSSWRASARSPTLLRTIDGLAEGNATFSTATHGSEDGGAAFINDIAFHRSHELVLQTSGIQTIDILVSNFDDGNHPLHLHGYKYFVLAQGHGYPPMLNPVDGMTRENIQPLYSSLDFSNPLRRDTASVEAFGWVLLRLVADNPGAWALHCHISWHTEAGLLMQLLTRTDELVLTQIPAANRDLCAAEGIEKGMGPEDEDYRDLAK